LTHGTASWTHADPATAAPAVTLPLPESIDGDLFVLLEEGDNQPLPIEKATILLPSYAIRLHRPADTPLRLIYGKDNIAPPRYDLQLLAPQVMGRVAQEVAAGPEQAFSAASTINTAAALSPVVFWSVLGLAVLVLLGMVVKLMRREGAA